MLYDVRFSSVYVATHHFFEAYGQALLLMWLENEARGWVNEMKCG